MATEADERDEPTTIPMRLVCPSCGRLHIDEGEFATKSHHTHACQNCGNVWRPAIVPTVGVRFLPGFKNEPVEERVNGQLPSEHPIKHVSTVNGNRIYECLCGAIGGFDELTDQNHADLIRRKDQLERLKDQR